MGYEGDNQPYDAAAQPVGWSSVPAPAWPQMPLLGSGQSQALPPYQSPQPSYQSPQPSYQSPQPYVPEHGQQMGALRPEVGAPQFFGVAPPPAPVAPAAFAVPAIPVADAWQPRYVPSAPAASSPFVPPLARRDGVFGLSVGIGLVVLVFAVALALQAKMPGYAPPAPAAPAAPAASVPAAAPAVARPRG